ncbi:MAG: PIN domain-containing protein [Acidobacteriaceae bacterium]
MPDSVASLGGSSKLLLDSWPIMEWLKGREPVATQFEGLIEGGLDGRFYFLMSRMNYGEVLYSIKKDFPSNRVEQAIQAFLEIPMEVYSVDDALVDEAVELKAVYSISYADAFAAALSLRLDIPLATGDKELLALKKIGLKLHWMGA